MAGTQVWQAAGFGRHQGIASTLGVKSECVRALAVQEDAALKAAELEGAVMAERAAKWALRSVEEQLDITDGWLADARAIISQVMAQPPIRQHCLPAYHHQSYAKN